MTTNEHELLERLMDRWEAARTAGHPLTAAELSAEAPELHDVLARRIRVLEWALRHEGRGSSDSLPLSAIETALAAGEEATARLPVSAVAAGDTFDGLELVRRIGGGGMGEVWEAFDPRLKRRVAVKFIRPELATNTTARRRFAREAMACAAVQHENVVSVYDVGEFRDRPYLVMPLLEGETLTLRLKREPVLPFPEGVRIGRAVAAGLDALHTRGLTHRDVKPANIWLGTDGSVKLLDLGLARIGEHLPDSEPLSDAGQVVGTPAYMAPEQADGREVSARSDLFSLGVVLYQTTTGISPFSGPSLLAALSALATRTPLPPSSFCPDIPPAFDELMAGLLAKPTEERRPDTAKGVVARLDAITAGERGVSAPVTTPKRPLWPWLVTLAATVVALITGAVAWLSQPPSPNAQPSPNEQVRQAARQLRKRSITNSRTEDKVGGWFKNMRHYEFTFEGTTGEPVCSDVENGSAVVKLPYTGRNERASWDLILGTRVNQLHETNTVGGVIEVKVSVGPGGIRLTDYELMPTGDVLALTHDANVSAREALLSLLREVMPEK